jgi:hypothetical protein
MARGELCGKCRQRFCNLVGVDQFAAFLRILQSELVGLLFRESLALRTGRFGPMIEDPGQCLLEIDTDLTAIHTPVRHASRDPVRNLRNTHPNEFR